MNETVHLLYAFQGCLGTYLFHGAESCFRSLEAIIKLFIM